MNWRDRLSRVRIEIGDEARRRQLSEIHDALDRMKAPPRRHGRTLAIAIAAVLALPVMALAAENARPGDLFYPVRQILRPASEDPTPQSDVVARSDAASPGERQIQNRPGADRRSDPSRRPTDTTSVARTTVPDSTTTTVPERPATTGDRPPTTTTVPRCESGRYRACPTTTQTGR